MAFTVDIVEQIHRKPFENHLMTAKKQGITCEESEEFQEVNQDQSMIYKLMNFVYSR